MTNIYTTATNVLDELPGTIPEALDAKKIAAYIADASRYVDARLTNYATFNDIAGTPKTPAIIEKTARMLAAHDCLVFMGESRGDEKAGDELRRIAEKILDDLNPADGSTPRAIVPPDEYDYSQPSKAEVAGLVGSGRSKPIYRADISRDEKE